MKELKRRITAGELSKELGLNLEGEDVLISNVASLFESTEESLTFSTKTIASRVLGCVVAKGYCGVGTVICADNPRLSFARALRYLVSNGYLDSQGVKHSIHPSVIFGRNALVEYGVVIGKNTLIGENAIIRSNVVIGENCIIGPNAVIGNRGFGYERDETGVPIHMPHVGGVLVGDNVDIGAMTTVISGTLGPTIIGNNTKLDDHVHFGHNCSVGESSIITACSEFSGGVHVGNRVWVGPNVSIKEKLRIGDDSYIGLAAVVLKDVEGKTVVVGNPAKLLRRTE